MTIDNAEFKDRVAIVTGAGRGMGRAVAHRLAVGGAKLVVNDMASDSAVAVASELRDSGVLTNEEFEGKKKFKIQNVL